MIWNLTYRIVALDQVVLQSSMQDEDSIEHTDCHVFTN